MHRWNHLVESADLQLRELERAYTESPNLETLEAYLTTAQRYSRFDIVRQLNNDKRELERLATLPKGMTQSTITRMRNDNTPNRVNAALVIDHGTVLYHRTNVNRDGSPQRWRVTGMVKFWKTRPTHFKIPVKYGMYDSDYVTHENADEFSLDENDARR